MTEEKQKRGLEKSPEEKRDQKQSDKQQAQKRTAISAHVVHEAIRREGVDELKRPTSALAWSALAAGLSMGFSLVAEGLLHSMLPDAAWRPLVAKFGYCIGFLIVILGRQQLFTENTLTVILPMLERWDKIVFKNVCRLWAVVFTGNLVGAFLFAWLIGNTEVFEVPVRETFKEIGLEVLGNSFLTTMLRGLFAGWLIALMVWLLPFADTNRVLVIILITFVVGIGQFSHIVAGSVEMFYLVVTGAASFMRCLTTYMIPTLIGNIIGGVALVAMLNHAQVVAGDGQDV